MPFLTMHQIYLDEDILMRAGNGPTSHMEWMIVIDRNITREISKDIRMWVRMQRSHHTLNHCSWSYSYWAWIYIYSSIPALYMEFFFFFHFDFQCIVLISFMSISSAGAFTGMAQNPTDDKSALVHLLSSWCHQTTSHYMDQCLLWSLKIWHH